eukprot:gene29955-39131_t
MDQRVKTIAANAAIEAAQKKKENPYLAHKSIVPGNASIVPGLASVPGMTGLVPEVADDRLPVAPRRDLRAKKGLKFEADSLRKKEERKLIAGYSSGRKTLEDDYPLAAISNCKFLKLIQHPIPVRPPGSTGDRPTPVLLCPTERLNLVVVEGGPKGIRKIPWHEAGNNSDEFESGEEGDDSLRNPNPNRCDLLWSGALARRLFTGFKFTESRNSAAAKKLLDGKGLVNTTLTKELNGNLAQRIDDIRDSAKIL